MWLQTKEILSKFASGSNGITLSKKKRLTLGRLYRWLHRDYRSYSKAVSGNSGDTVAWHSEASKSTFNISPCCLDSLGLSFPKCKIKIIKWIWFVVWRIKWHNIHKIDNNQYDQYVVDNQYISIPLPLAQYNSGHYKKHIISFTSYNT